ncbi:hypothetical protein SPI_09322 [Niveomyces insectorum RCEF 264]|uniref:Uncharacterized protein n=1 Tax=Niveomyces insectorum RCEF 264 TaxID=1081102 RepID=A0A162I885_9HYPO|nr:hypothetical protein SPI_09322 [Niveomyces insectorum RCEF 264]
MLSTAPAVAFLHLALLAGPAAAVFGLHNQPPKAVTTRADDFPWTNPFGKYHAPLAATCTAQRTFRANEFLLHDLFEAEPKGLWPYADALKGVFSGRPYPGGWDGLDPHMYDRPLLSMAYADVPVAVREWIEEQERAVDGEGGDDGGDKTKSGKNLFAVFERAHDGTTKVPKTVRPQATLEKARMFRPLDKKRIVVFAPGALYRILPLWVAEDSACKDQLLDLANYSPTPKDGAVVAWTTLHTATDRHKDDRGMTFTIKAQVLADDAVSAAGADKAADGTSKDEL